MGPLPTSKASRLDSTAEAARDDNQTPLEVLLTGFGPFGKNLINPSWSIASQLHDVTLYPPIPPPLGHKQRDIHIQSLNLPVIYTNTLDVVPRIHGQTPASPYASMRCDDRGPQDGAQGDGINPYSAGYAPRLQHPCHGYDLVIHIGLGLNGGYRVEQQAHKAGYDKQDVSGQYAPPVDTDDPPIADSSKGFGKGYEDFEREERTDIDVASLVAHLSSRGCGPISTSHDPGRYLCDFTYYCSLAESRRRSPEHSPATTSGSADERKKRTQVLFIHVPAEGQPQSIEEGRKMLIDAVGQILWGQ